MVLPLPAGERVGVVPPLPAGERVGMVLPLPAGERVGMALPLPAGERVGVRGHFLDRLVRNFCTPAANSPFAACASWRYDSNSTASS